MKRESEAAKREYNNRSLEDNKSQVTESKPRKKNNIEIIICDEEEDDVKSSNKITRISSNNSLPESGLWEKRVFDNPFPGWGSSNPWIRQPERQNIEQKYLTFKPSLPPIQSNPIFLANKRKESKLHKIGFEFELLFIGKTVEFYKRYKGKEVKMSYADLIGETLSRRGGFAISPDNVGYSDRTTGVLEVATDPVLAAKMNNINLLCNNLERFRFALEKSVEKLKETKGEISLNEVFDRYNDGCDDGFYKKIPDEARHLYFIADNQNNRNEDDSSEYEYVLKLKNDKKNQGAKSKNNDDIQIAALTQCNFGLPIFDFNHKIFSADYFCKNLPTQDKKLFSEGVEKHYINPEDTFIDDFGDRKLININAQSLKNSIDFIDKNFVIFEGDKAVYKNIAGFFGLLYHYVYITHLAESGVIDKELGIQQHSDSFGMKEYFKINPKVNFSQLYSLLDKEYITINIHALIEKMFSDIQQKSGQHNLSKLRFYDVDCNGFSVQKLLSPSEFVNEIKDKSKIVSTSTKPIDGIISQESGSLVVVFESRFSDIRNFKNLKEIMDEYLEIINRYSKEQSSTTKIPNNIVNFPTIKKESKNNNPQIIDIL